MVLNVLPGLSITELEAFHVLKYFLQFYKMLGRFGNWACKSCAISSFPSLSHYSRGLDIVQEAKDNSFILVSATWPQTKKYILRCKCHYKGEESWGTGIWLRSGESWHESIPLIPLDEELKVGRARLGRVLLLNRSAIKHRPVVEDHVSGGLAREAMVLGGGDALKSEPGALLLNGCENLDRSVHVSDSGSGFIKMEMMYLPH